MASTVLLILLTLLLAYIFSLFLKSIHNYRLALSTTLPIRFTPISFLNPIYLLLGDYLIPFLASLPFSLGSFRLYTGFDLFHSSRYYLHQKHGPAYTVFSPHDISIVVADAKCVEDICARRKGMEHWKELYEPLEVFGANLDTVNGETWQRHRRITTPPFNERNSKSVWKESLRQAKGMIGVWVKEGLRDGGKGGRGKSVKDDTTTLAMHVLTSAGFGQKFDFEGGLGEVGKGHKLSYRESMRIVMTNIFLGIIVSSAKSLPTFLLPGSWKEVKVAMQEFKEYMQEMVEKERKGIREKEEVKDNLLSVLVRGSEEKGGNGRNGLSEEEILGNLFLYNVAGHDTTANTLAFAMMLVAVEREVQDWVGEEIRSVFPNGESEEWGYEEGFGRLKRCLALMYETMRLYGPVVMFPKYTGETPTTITIDSKTIPVPAHTNIITNVAALNTLPSYWGSDSLIFRPSRWILTNPETGQEELFQPEAGLFVPWSAGPRVCPGKKFAQVEFVAVVARLFWGDRVRVKGVEGEKDGGRERVRKVVEDSQLNLTLQMRHPERVELVWEEVKQ